MIDYCHKFYSLLKDELSKHICLSRLMYSVSGDKKWIKEIVNELPEGRWLYSLPRGECDYIFGCGMYGHLMYRYLANNWKGFVDNNYLKYPNGLFGLKVLPPSSLPKNARVFICVKYYEKEIYEQLLDLGIDQKNIINIGAVLVALEKRQYFDLPELRHDKREVFVDAGSLNGDTAKRFLDWCGGDFEHIYCFEPDKDNYKVCKKRLQDMNLQGGIQLSPRLFTMKKGIWNSFRVPMDIREYGWAMIWGMCMK